MSKPAFSRANRTTSRICASSSTTRILIAMAPPRIMVRQKKHQSCRENRRGRATLELFRPTYAAGELHDHEQRNDRANGNRQAAKSFEEEGIGKQHEIDQLRRPSFNRRETHADDQAQVADHQRHRYNRADNEGNVDRNHIDQVRKQEVKGKKPAGEKEIIHWMKLDAAQRRDDEHQEEEKQQRYRREVTDSSRQRTGLKLLRHDHDDLKSRQ